MADSEDELLAVAHAAARAAAWELLQRFGQNLEGIHAKSSPTDLVSEADLAAEAAIRGVLAERRPHDAILGEEGGATGDGELRWVIDPLDGTTNFLFGVPQFAVSVACEDRSGALVGVVLDPVRSETFAASRSGSGSGSGYGSGSGVGSGSGSGSGVGSATLNGFAISGSVREELSTALIATGFDYDAKVRGRQAPVLGVLLPRVRDIRRAGAAALDLAWCACGRYDGYFERGVKAWDVAAGSLIAAQAGLSVRQLPASEALPAGVVVAAPALVDQLLALIQEGEG